jgi:hypothetical protein
MTNSEENMKTIGLVMIFSLLVVALTSCKPATANPTEMPTSTTTSVLTVTSTPKPTITPTATPTQTPEPTITSTVTPTDTPVPPTETPTNPALPLPSGTPLTTWKGFPIMPGAIAGDGDNSSYSFTVQASFDDVQEFYTNELAQLGWNLFTSGQGTTGTLLLMYMKGTDILSVSIIPQPEGLMYVMLVTRV